jgi:hypothetical protein
MAGGRKGRRKPGRGEGDNEAARDGQNAMAAHTGREKASETADVEAEQWLNPFRIGRPVTPVISHRQGIDDLPGSQLPRRHARGEPIRAVPVEAVPADEVPVQGVPVQIWHEPPPEDWQSGQQPPGGSVRYGHPRGYGPPRPYRGAREGYPDDGHGRDAGHPGYQWSGSGDDYDPGGGYTRPDSYSGYPPAAYGAPGGYAPPRYGPPGEYGPPGDYSAHGGYGAPGEHGSAGDYGPPGSDGRRGRRSGAWRDPGQGGYGPRGEFVRPEGYDAPNGYGSPRRPARLPPDGRAERYGPGYRPEDSFAPDHEAPRPRYGSPGQGRGRGSGPGDSRDAGAGYGPPAGYRGRSGHGPADAYAPDPGYGPGTGYGRGGQRPPAPDQYGQRNRGWAGDGDRGQLSRRVRQGYAADDARAAPREPWRGDGRRPAGPGMPADPAAQRPPADPAWDGRSRHRDGYRRESARWPAPGDGYSGPGDARYEPGGVERGYDRRMRAAYGPGDAFSRGQRPWPDPNAGVAGRPRGADQADQASGQLPRPGASAGPARKVAPPAALPPGPSASAESDTRIPAETSLAADRGAPGGLRPGAQSADAASQRPASDTARAEEAPTSAVAAAPPSPTGTVPPAVGTLAEPVPVAAAAQVEAAEDDTVSPDADTTPMAVILGDRPAVSDGAAAPRSAPDGPIAAERPGALPAPRATGSTSLTAGPRMRGPFEPANNLAPLPAAPLPRPAVQAASDQGASNNSAGAEISTVAGSSAGASAADTSEPGAASAATTKMDQLKDLYLTAEAIGENALDQNFQLVSDRQRQLIREYFDLAIPGQADTGDTTS